MLNDRAYVNCLLLVEVEAAGSEGLDMQPHKEAHPGCRPTMCQVSLMCL